jgi:hypothetical protein
MPAEQPDDLRDDEIYEALVSGLTPEQVAAERLLPLEQVLAAGRRIKAKHAALGPKEAARERQCVTLPTIARMALSAWQRSIAQGEETHTVSAGEAGANKQARRAVFKNSGDPRYLQTALRALLQESALRRLEDDSTDPAQAAAPRLPAHLTAAYLEAGQKHPDYEAHQRTVYESFLEGESIAHLCFDFSDPRYDPRLPEKPLDGSVDGE